MAEALPPGRSAEFVGAGDLTRHQLRGETTLAPHSGWSRSKQSPIRLPPLVANISPSVALLVASIFLLFEALGCCSCLLLALFVASLALLIATVGSVAYTLLLVAVLRGALGCGSFPHGRHSWSLIL
jgi:hypothetical protein